MSVGRKTAKEKQMKLGENVMQFLRNLSATIAPQPAYAFAMGEGSNDDCWGGSCTGNCSGGCPGGCEGDCAHGCGSDCGSSCGGNCSGGMFS